VSFNVWYWDTALQGWTSVSAPYGWAVLGTNVLLCAAWCPAIGPCSSHAQHRESEGPAMTNWRVATRLVLVGGWYWPGSTS